MSAYAQMMPRLQAEEALLAAQVAALPYAKQADQSKVLRRWSEAASGERAKPADPRQVVAGLAAAGMKVIRERREAGS